MLADRWPLPTIFLAAIPAVCGAVAIYLVGRTPQGTAGGAVISLGLGVRGLRIASIVQRTSRMKTWKNRRGILRVTCASQ